MFTSAEMIMIYNALVSYKGKSLEVSEQYDGAEIKVTDLIEKVKTTGLELLKDE